MKADFLCIHAGVYRPGFVRGGFLCNAPPFV
nr:MAG TPA: hypothetical protein [Caudoviricetes sp.]